MAHEGKVPDDGNRPYSHQEYPKTVVVDGKEVVFNSAEEEAGVAIEQNSAAENAAGPAEESRPGWKLVNDHWEKIDEVKVEEAEADKPAEKAANG
jgi:hypothetical protein